MMPPPGTPLPPSPADPAPLAPFSETIRSEWIDYNGHMNVAYYVLVFDHATDAVLDHVGLDADLREATGSSVFVVESHVTYNREVMEGDEVVIRSHVLGVDQKRLHLFHQMFAPNGDLAATNELLLLHVDLNSRRTSPFPEAPGAALTSLAQAAAAAPDRPSGGRSIKGITGHSSV